MRLLCLLLVLLCGCPRTPPPRDGGSTKILGVPTYWEESDFPLTIVISDAVSSETALATYIAAEVWNEMVDREVFEVERRDFSQPAGRVCGFVAVSQSDIQAGLDPKPEDWDAYHTPYLKPHSSQLCAGNIVVDEGLDQDWTTLVMVHELGHALTLEHDPDPSSIMYYAVQGVNTTQSLQTEDILRVRAMVDGIRMDIVPDAVFQQGRLDFLIRPQIEKHHLLDIFID